MQEQCRIDLTSPFTSSFENVFTNISIFFLHHICILFSRLHLPSYSANLRTSPSLSKKTYFRTCI